MPHGTLPLPFVQLMHLVFHDRACVATIAFHLEPSPVNLVFWEQVGHSGSTAQQVRFDGSSELKGTRCLGAEDDYVCKIVLRIRR